VSRTRSYRRVLAGFALWASLWSLALPVLEAHPLGVSDDAACQVLFSPDEHDTLGIAGPGVPGARPEHCDVCHLQRAVSGAFASDGTSIISPLAAPCRNGLTASLPVEADAAAPASRGPPVALHN
jgi:hypothetical protein